MPQAHPPADEPATDSGGEVGDDKERSDLRLERSPSRGDLEQVAGCPEGG